MDLQTMVGRIRKTLGEVEPNGYNTQADGTGSWDNSQIIGYINEGLQILAKDWHKEKVGTIAVTNAGQTDFPFPTDCLEDGIRKVLYSTAGVSYPVSFVDLDLYLERASIGTTTAQGSAYNNYTYTVWSGTIKLWPPANLITDAVVPYYYRLPTALQNATDVPEIPVRFHQALCFYGIMECQNAVEETNLESDVAQKWFREQARFRTEMSKNQRDQGIRARGRGN